MAAGADEIDMVIDRGAFLAGDYLTVFRQIAEVRAVCGDARLKVIMETGELVTYDNVRRASWLSMLAGADFIKTSTGKVSPAATLPVTLVMLEAVRDWRDTTGAMVGVKPAGGIRTSKDAIRFLVTVSEVAGEEWLDKHWFRFGASSLLNDLILQRQRVRTGALPCRLHRRRLPQLTAATGSTERGTRTDAHLRVRTGPRVTGRRRHRQPATACSSTVSSWRPPVERRSRRSTRRGGARRGVRGELRRRRRGREGGAHGIHPRVVPDERRRPRQVPVPDRPHPPGAGPRVRGPRDARQRQAHQGGRDVDLPLAAAHFFYHAGWADKLEHASLGPDPRPGASSARSCRGTSPCSCWRGRSRRPSPAGNTVVLKPAETTPLSALLLADVCRQADLPPGVVNIVTGAGATGQALVDHPGIDKLAFTGSTAVGKMIARSIAGTRKKATLELGGKAANIIFDDAPIDQAVEGIVNGIFFNQGHVCCAGSGSWCRRTSPRS